MGSRLEVWKKFGKAPMKAITADFPSFVLCNGFEMCFGQCVKYHPPVDAELDGVILDLWSRSWQSLRGGRVQKKDADHFKLCLECQAFVGSLCKPCQERKVYTWSQDHQMAGELMKMQQSFGFRRATWEWRSIDCAQWKEFRQWFVMEPSMESEWQRRMQSQLTRRLRLNRSSITSTFRKCLSSDHCLMELNEQEFSSSSSQEQNPLNICFFGDFCSLKSTMGFITDSISTMKGRTSLELFPSCLYKSKSLWPIKNIGHDDHFLSYTKINVTIK